MYVKIFTILLLLFCLSVNSITLSQNRNKKKKPIKILHQSSSVKSLDDYDPYWRQIDSLDALTMTRTAKKIAEDIYSFALNEKNEKQALKALFVKLSYENILDDKNVTLIVKELREGINIFEFPERNIIQSALAGKYCEYYHNVYYKKYGRSVVENDTSQDFETWSLNRLRREADMLFTASLEKSRELKQIAASEYSEFILKGNIFGEKFRLTLYDMLCHQALNSISGYLYSIDKFDIKSPADSLAFGSAEEFVKIKGDKTDSVLIQNKVVKILADLTEFHINDTLKTELCDINLKRLDYFYRNSDIPLKDSVYLKALNKMLNVYNDTSSVPGILATIAAYYNEGSHNWISSKNKGTNAKKAIEYSNMLLSKFPNSFGAMQAKAIKNNILKKSLHLQTENAVLPGEPFRVLVVSTNINKVYFRIIESLSAEADTIRSDSSIIKYYRNLKPYAQFGQVLPEGDYLSHTYDVIFPSLPMDKYIILASTDSSFSNKESHILYQYIFVTNLSAVIKPENDRCLFSIMDRKTGNPLSDVIVKISPEKTLKTDDNGFVVTPLSTGYSNIALYKGKDFFEFGYHSYDQNSDDRRVGETLFFLDRAIYRPGQTVYFKGLSAIHDKKTGEREIWKYREVTIKLYDANRRIVSELKTKTNKYGSFNGKFELPSNLLNGNWRISDGYGSSGFHVEEYKRPQFEVRLNKNEGEYNLDAEINITGTAQAYSGASISGAEVKYRVERSIHYAYGDWNYRPGYAPFGGSTISNGKLNSDEKGGFTINFKALRDADIKTDKIIYNYRIYVQVIDRTGETHNAETNVLAGNVYNLIYADISEIVNKRNMREYGLTTTNLNGSFKPTKVKLTVTKLKIPGRIFRNSILGRPDTSILSRDEFYRIFENDVYKNEDNYTTWEKEKLVYDTSFTTREGTTLSNNLFSRFEQGKYILTLSAEENGRSVEFIRYFTCLDPLAEKIPLNDAFWFNSLQSVIEPGEDLSLSLGTALKELNILFEIEHRGNIIKREWLKINNEQRELKIPIKEKYRGGIILHGRAVWNNTIITFSRSVIIPWSNKKLNLELMTYRSEMRPGESEKWKIRVKDNDGDPVNAELLVSMYDKSLDELHNNYGWNFNIYNNYYQTSYWNNGSFTANTFHFAFYPSQVFIERPRIQYNEFHYYGLFNTQLIYSGPFKSRTVEKSFMGDLIFPESVRVVAEKPIVQKNMTASFLQGGRGDEVAYNLDGVPFEEINRVPLQTNDESNFLQIVTRKNFNETAFFYPHLYTNSSGEAEFSFTAPEALTKWKLMAFAHTRDLQGGLLLSEAVTQKKLSVQTFPPRFFRENDTIWFTSRVSNLTDSIITGKAVLKCSDPNSNEEIDDYLGNTGGSQEFHLNPRETTVLSWKLNIPEGKFQLIKYKVLAFTKNISDGEENIVPVLSNKILITESLPLPVKGNQSRTFIFENMIKNKSATLQNHKLVFEYTANPVFLALQTLPSLMENYFESADNIFNNYYAVNIAMHAANSNPKIKEAYESWKTSGKESFLSKLQKNQELKNILMETTPWITEAEDESENKVRLGRLFDSTNLSRQFMLAEQKLIAMQLPEGGWSWFPGMPENMFVTHSIVEGFAHMKNLCKLDLRNNGLWISIIKALKRCDEKMNTDYLRCVQKDSLLKDIMITNEKIHYLYARSYFPEYRLNPGYEKAFNFWKNLAVQSWKQQNFYLQGMIALMCYRYDNNEIAEKIMRSILDNSITDNERGIYLKSARGSFWHDAPLETQALLIEATDEILHDTNSVDQMKIWILKNKQTNGWGSGRASSLANYALLLRGTNWITGSEPAEIKIGDLKLDTMNNSSESGTGYIKKSWNTDEIKQEMSKVSITNKNNAPAWGALYWQYFEQMDKVTGANSQLNINKEVFIQTGHGKNTRLNPINSDVPLKAGDLITVRLIIKSDRDMEFVHIKDLRASGLEPLDVLSVSKYRMDFVIIRQVKMRQQISS